MYILIVIFLDIKLVDCAPNDAAAATTTATTNNNLI
jgi:hypothetical protein